ncbi:MAG: hypothetical protein JWQ43_3085 [Glaciihabitans sp.]|nr:hypothetical protein [Glaciihabitans sp.]
MIPPLERLSTGLVNSVRVVGFVEYVFRRSDKSGDIFPNDDPHGSVDGNTPQRIVIVGEANAVGLGVTRHTLGMAGHVARLLASRTGHGVHWSAVRVDGMRIRNASATVRANRELLQGADLVVVMLGIVDTLSLTSRRTWAIHLNTVMDNLDDILPVGAKVVVTRIPPMDNAGSVSRLARLAAGAQARVLNRTSDALLAGRSRVQLVAFPESLRQELWSPESRETPYVGMYSAWATAVVDEVAPVSDRSSAATTPPTN